MVLSSGWHVHCLLPSKIKLSRERLPEGLCVGSQLGRWRVWERDLRIFSDMGYSMQESLGFIIRL